MGFLACLTVLGLVLCAGSAARADVDTRGELRAISPVLSAPGEVKPLVSTENEDFECTTKYSTMEAGAFTWAIGNCAKGSTLEAVVRRLHSDSEPEGNYALGGWVGGAFQGCGWIEYDLFKPKAIKSKPTTSCTEIAEGKHEVAESNFIAKHNSGAGDGYFVVNKVACPEYANYRPWTSGNLEEEKIRTVPAYAAQEPGSNVPELKWRYVTKYSSTDGTGQYVMVRDAAVTLKEEKEKVYGQGNWVFVPRSCLPSTLPENEEESRIPPKPVVTTEGPTGVQTPFATLKGSVNPEGVPTTYYFQYGTTMNWNEYSTPPVEIGSGTSPLSESASISGLAGGTTYYFRIVATSAIGTSAGGPVGFTTQPPPTVTTNAATSVLEEQGTLNATVNGNGLNTKVRFEYGETTTYGLSTSWEEVGSGVSSPSAVVTNLRPDTTYHYCVVASNSAGPSGCGQDLSFKTSAHPGLVAANGTVSAASQDINNALYLTTRNLTTGVWQSALLGEGTGTTYSAPSGVVDSGGNVWVAAEGPGNRLLDGVHATTGAWNPSYESAGGTAYSAPSEVIDSLGNIWLAAEGTKHTLVIAERSHSTGAWETWTAVSGEDVYSAPSAAVGSGGELWIAFEGPNNLLWDGVESSGHTWTPSTEGTSGAVYSAPSEVVDSSGNVWAVGQGTNRTLVVAERVAKTGAWQSSTLITAESIRRRQSRWGRVANCGLPLRDPKTIFGMAYGQQVVAGILHMRGQEPPTRHPQR